jgi:hypothetical protein
MLANGDGVLATFIQRTGRTFICATVPTGALTGSVTVTTGTTKFTSHKQFRVTTADSEFHSRERQVGDAGEDYQSEHDADNYGDVRRSEGDHI